jgi:hypothetical protein
VGRWLAGLVVCLLLCIPILAATAASQRLFEDTDTQVLLAAIRERQNPLSWFVGDWPLGNHFYRPISTLFFEMDNALYGDRAWGYGLTNSLLAVGCVLLLFWFVREFTDSPLFATAAAALFAIWTVDWSVFGWLRPILQLLPFAALIVLLPGRRIWPGILLAFVTLYALFEVQGLQPLGFRMIGWIPGRTASVMTFFALISLAAYARYERLFSRRDPAPYDPLEPPATRTTILTGPPAKWERAWVGVSILALALALGSYEQAVMLPAALLGVAVSFRLRRFRPRWGWQAVFWSLLVGYLLLRAAVVPSEVSGYQQQQFRSGPGVALDLADYAFPAASRVYLGVLSFERSWVLLVVPLFWATLLGLISNLLAYFALRRKWHLALTGWALSLIAFLPMAWLKPFDHYHYWPMAMRSIFVVSLFWVLWELFVSAASRPALQAPQRPSPAPGSLPHP